MKNRLDRSGEKNREKPRKKPKVSAVQNTTVSDRSGDIKGKILIALGALGLIAFLAKQNCSTAPEKNKPQSSAEAKKPKNETKKVPQIKTSEIQQMPFLKGERAMQMLEMQKYWEKIALDAIGMFKDAHPKMPQLIEFMKKNAVYSIPTGPKATQRIFLGRMEDLIKNQNPNEFEIVFMPGEFVESMPSSIFTEDHGNTMRIATTFKIKEWLGIILAHELSHVHDQKVDGENSEDQRQYFKGEGMAYDLEKSLLKFWDPETYKTLMEQGIPLWQKRKIPELAELARSLYPINTPQVSPHEAALGEASVLLSVAIEEARQKGASDDDLGKVYANATKILKEFK